MIVRIRFRRGPRVERKKGKNSRLAWVTAGFVTLASVSCLCLALWRLGGDFGVAAEFVFADGSFFSHWQVWLLAAITLQLTAWRLNRYGMPKESPAILGPRKAETEKKQMAANV
jgi:hypothetical protein